MFYKTCLSALILVSVIVNSFAQNDKTLSFSLEAAIQYAIQNNTQSKNTRVDSLIYKKKTAEILSVGLPQMSIDVKYQDNLKLPTTVIPANAFEGFPPTDREVSFGTQHNVYADFLLNQLIVDGRYFIGLKANRTMMEIAGQQVKLTDAEVKNNVTKSYCAVLVAGEGVEIIKKNLTTLEKLLNETSELYNSGFVEELDVDRLHLQLANMQSLDKKVALQLELAMNLLKYNMGAEHTAQISLTDSLENLLVSGAIDTASSFNYEQRVEYSLLNNQFKMRGFDAQRTRAEYLPSLSGYFGYEFNAQREEFDIFDFNQKWFNVSYVGLMLHIPIYDSYRNGAIYRQKKLEQLKISNQINDFKQSSNLQVSQAKIEYQTALDEFDIQKQNIALAEKIYDKVKTKYQEGVGSSLELANAEASLSETQSGYINAMYNLLVKRSDLNKALGNY